jgi:hypothetical protein
MVIDSRTFTISCGDPCFFPPSCAKCSITWCGNPISVPNCMGDVIFTYCFLVHRLLLSMTRGQTSRQAASRYTSDSFDGTIPSHLIAVFGQNKLCISHSMLKWKKMQVTGMMSGARQGLIHERCNVSRRNWCTYFCWCCILFTSNNWQMMEAEPMGSFSL